MGADQEICKNPPRSMIALPAAPFRIALECSPANRQIVSLKFQSTTIPFSSTKEPTKSSVRPEAE